MSLDAHTLRALANWADVEVRRPSGGEIDHYYWGYDGVSNTLRNLASRVEAHGSFDRREGDERLNEGAE